jgi:hypothetical protein
MDSLYSLLLGFLLSYHALEGNDILITRDSEA